MLYKFLDGSLQVIGTVFGFSFWTVVRAARTGQSISIDPQYEQRIEGHKLGFVRGIAEGELRPINGGGTMAQRDLAKFSVRWGRTPYVVSDMMTA